MSPVQWLWLLAAAAAFFLGLSATPLFDLDEGAFTAATVEMWLRGDFLSTYLSGEPRYDKPILIYWLQALSVWVFGFSEFAFRLPSAIMGLVWTMLAFVVASRVYGPNAGVMAATVTATTISVACISRLAIADALLNACIAAAVFFQYLWFRFGQANKDLLIAWVAMALGFLAKGPVAIVVPLAALFLHCASLGRWREFWVYVTRWQAILLFLAIALPWYVAVTVIKGPEFIKTFFLHHNLGRFSGAMGDPHDYGLFFYLPVLPLVTLPYTALLFSMIPRLRQLWREDDFARYALILFFLVFMIFTLSTNKLPHYLLYGLSALLVLFSRLLSEVSSRWHLLPPLLLGGLMLFLPSILTLVREHATPYYQIMLADLDAHFGPGYFAVFAVFLIVMIVFWIDRRLALATKLIVAGLLGVYALAFALLPALGNTLQQPIKQAGLIAKGIDAPLVVYGFNTPSVGVYAQRIVERRRPKPGEMALTQVKRLEDLPAHEVLFRSNHIALIRVLSP